MTRWFHFLGFLLILLTSCLGGKIRVKETPPLQSVQFRALQDFYNDLHGANWFWRNTTVDGIAWNFTAPNANPCADNWQGVQCTCLTSMCYVQSLSLKKYPPVTVIPLSNSCRLKAFT